MANGGLKWELRALGTLREISAAIKDQFRGLEVMEAVPKPYEAFDVSPFNPSPAVYFMDGYSNATVRIRKSGEELFFEWFDENTSIAASAPLLSSEEKVEKGAYLPVPAPLRPAGRFPTHIPDRYRRETTIHLLQVLSMNMKSRDGKSRLLIGLPYAEHHAGLFFSALVSGDKQRGAASYGVVQSLTDLADPATGEKTVQSNGYPARSIFAVYHILESKLGVLFNKKPTVMELQPDAKGKLALALPPIPFQYRLINGPIPLFDMKDPQGEPIADILAAHHNGPSAASQVTEDSWPYHRPDLDQIEADIAAWES